MNKDKNEKQKSLFFLFLFNYNLYASFNVTPLFLWLTHSLHPFMFMSPYRNGISFIVFSLVASCSRGNTAAGQSHAQGRRLTRAASSGATSESRKNRTYAARSTTHHAATGSKTRRPLSDGATWPCAQQHAPWSLFRVSAPFSGKIKVI
jgi:hypothetical protein